MKLHNRINLSLLGIYYLPQSTNILPDSIFIDHLCGEVHDLLPEHSNLILLGDLNTHINDLSNEDAVMLIDALSALGLRQIVTKATHQSGNTRDLIFIEEETGLAKQLNRCVTGEFLSDHRWVMVEFYIKQLLTKTQEVKSRKLSPDLKQELGASSSFSELIHIDDPKALYMEYDAKMSQLYNQIAPESTVKQSLRKRVPWFTAKKNRRKLLGIGKWSGLNTNKTISGWLIKRKEQI